MLTSVCLGGGDALESSPSSCYLDDQNWPGGFGNHGCLRSEIRFGGTSDAGRNMCKNNLPLLKRISRIPGNCS